MYTNDDARPANADGDDFHVVDALPFECCDQPLIPCDCRPECVDLSGIFLSGGRKLAGAGPTSATDAGGSTRTQLSLNAVARSCKPQKRCGQRGRSPFAPSRSCPGSRASRAAPAFFSSSTQDSLARSPLGSSPAPHPVVERLPTHRQRATRRNNTLHRANASPGYALLEV